MAAAAAASINLLTTSRCIDRDTLHSFTAAVGGVSFFANDCSGASLPQAQQHPSPMTVFEMAALTKLARACGLPVFAEHPRRTSIPACAGPSAGPRHIQRARPSPSCSQPTSRDTCTRQQRSDTRPCAPVARPRAAIGQHFGSGLTGPALAARPQLILAEFPKLLNLSRRRNVRERPQNGC